MPTRANDPVVMARWAIGWVWPGLLALVFGAGLTGDGVAGGVYWCSNPDVVRGAWGLACLAALGTALLRWPRLVIAAAGVIALTALGRAWSLAGLWVASRHEHLSGITTYLVGTLLWAAVAIAHLVFAGALLGIIAADKRDRERGLT